LADAGTAAMGATGVMEATPPNKAYGKRVGAWMSGKEKHLQGLISDGLDWPARDRRYKKMHERHFDSVEANELVHGISFQELKTDNKTQAKDSKNNEHYDRLAVMAKCDGFDPNTEFRLKYAWSEKALDLAKSGFKHFGPFETASAVKMQFRSAAVLHMTEGQDGGAYIEYSEHLRAAVLPEVDAKAGISLAAWVESKDSHIMGIMGITDQPADRHLTKTHLLGFEVTFACGTRKAMHDLCAETPCTNDFTPEESMPFRECVKKGARDNAKLDFRLTPFVADEVVVRAYFTELPTNCMKEQENMATTEEDGEGNKRQGLEVYENFKTIIDTCDKINEGDAGRLPDALKKRPSTYKGTLLGKGLPQETLLEVLIDPADFLVDIF